MIKYIRQLLFLLLFTGSLYPSGYAQGKIQVVSRTVARTVNYKPGESLNIHGEKANIIINKSSDNNIHIKLSLISKNPSRKTAEEDLKYCDYKIDNRDNGVYLSNFFNVKNNYKEISSNLSAKYEIEVPEGVTISVSNIYGDINLSGIVGTIFVTSSFGQIYLVNISGSLNIKSSFADITGSSLKCPVIITSQSSDVKLNHINGVSNITSHFGNLYLSEIEASVKINADMTQVNLSLEDMDKYNLRLLAQKDKIFVPVGLKKSLVQSFGNTSLNYGKGEFSINIITNYSSINLK